MLLRATIALLAAAWLAAAPRPAAADTVRLANGNELEGRIVEESATEIVLETGGGRLRIPRAEIVESRRESEGRTLLHEARRWLSLDRPTRALPLVERALGLGEPQAAPVLVGALTALADQQLETGALPSAESTLDRARAALARVRAPAERSALEQAVERTRARLEQRRRAADTERRRAEQAAAARRWTEAAHSFSRALALDRSLSATVAAAHREACRHAGLALLQEGHYAEAALWLQRSLDPDRAPSSQTLRALGLSHIAVATLELDRNEIERAIRSLEVARALGGPVGELASVYRGLLAERRGRTARARRAFRAALGPEGDKLPAAAPLATLRARALARHAPLPLAPERFLAGLAADRPLPAFPVELVDGPFTVKAHDRELARRVAAAARRAARSLARWWPPAAREQPVTILVLPDAAHMAAALGRASDATRGVTRLRRNGAGRAVGRSIYTYAGARGLLEEVIPHEIVHALGPGSLAPQPLWLEEGLAQATVEPERRAAIARCRRTRGSPDAIALETLFALAAFPDDRDAQRRHYDTACAVTAFLSERAGGPAELARLCAQSEDPQDWLPALDLPSIAACQRAFDRWLSSR